MGGKDVIYLKQQHSSTLQPADVQKKLKEMADKRFLDTNGQYNVASDHVFPNNKVCAIYAFLFHDMFKIPILKFIVILLSFTFLYVIQYLINFFSLQFGTRTQRLTFANISPSSSYSHKEVCLHHLGWNKFLIFIFTIAATLILFLFLAGYCKLLQEKRWK